MGLEPIGTDVVAMIKDLEKRIKVLEKLNGGEGEFTNHLDFVRAFREFNTDPGFDGYNDKWVKAWDESGKAGREADALGTGTPKASWE